MYLSPLTFCTTSNNLCATTKIHRFFHHSEPCVPGGVLQKRLHVGFFFMCIFFRSLWVMKLSGRTGGVWLCLPVQPLSDAFNGTTRTHCEPIRSAVFPQTNVVKTPVDAGKMSPCKHISQQNRGLVPIERAEKTKYGMIPTELYTTCFNLLFMPGSRLTRHALCCATARTQSVTCVFV